MGTKREPIDIHDLLAASFGLSGRTTMRELRFKTGRSRQALWKHLRKLLLNGELVQIRGERGWAYAPGPGWPRSDRGALRGRVGQRVKWWHYLVERAPCVAYVNLAQIGVRLVKRSQARSALEGLYMKEFIFVDFEGVESVTDAFVEEMFVEWLQWGGMPIPINMNLEVGYRVRRAQGLSNVRLGREDD